MKGCLKQSSRAPSPAIEHATVKHVAFGSDGSDEIHVADEWDRTPAEPARHLSYQSVSLASTVHLLTICRDILELKEIQRSLPHAEQPADLIKPSSYYLSNVPIGLLPLLPTPDPNPILKSPSPVIPSPSCTHSHKNPRFTFLPLLPRSPSPPPSPPYSPPDTPTLTNDSSPRSTASSSSPEPSFLQLPPSCGHGRFCTLNKRPGFGASTSPFPTTPPPTPKNVIVINDIEIDLGDDHDNQAPSLLPSFERPTTPTQKSSSAPVLVPSAWVFLSLALHCIRVIFEPSSFWINDCFLAYREIYSLHRAYYSYLSFVII